MKEAEKREEKMPEKGAVKDPLANCASELGNIRLHDNVISNLVRRAVLSIPGVSRLSGSSLVDNLAEIVGSRKMQDRAIAIIKDEKDSSKVEIEIKLNMYFGYKVREVAEAVQHAVIESVENTANITVAAVNVSIQEIDDPPEPASEASEEESGITG